MANSDEFLRKTVKILAERAGQRCSNPECGRSTAGPSDDGSGKSTQLGKAAHITAAAKKGPRFDPTMTPEQRRSPDNGIWLCAECADRVDKRENETQYPVELLRHWKEFHESITGTDHATRQNRILYPVQKLTLINFAGVQGEAKINFGALTIFHGTSKLNQTVGELLRIFSDREKFEQTRQPRGGTKWNYARIPVSENKEMVITISKKKPRDFPKTGKIKIRLSDNKEFIVCSGYDDVSMSKEDTPLLVFSPVINVISLGSDFHRTVFGSPLSEEKPNTIEGLSHFFGISVAEMKACIKGAPSDSSLFGFDYEIRDDLDLRVKIEGNAGLFSLGMLSGGELNRFILDLVIRISTHLAKMKPTVLTLDQNHITSLDQRGWAFFFEWVEKNRPPFQIVVDRFYLPSEGNLSRALCYETIGTDMAVTSFKLLT